MKRFVLMLSFSFSMLFAFAQEEVLPDSLKAFQQNIDGEQLKFDKPLFFDDSFLDEGINFFDRSLFHQPLLPDYTKNLDLKKYLFSGITSQSYSFNSFGIHPFLNFGSVFNQASYRVNDRITIGGNSFGAQSVFDRPKMNPAIQDMSIKGASMYMQYKISDHFKVETRVSISNHQSPW